MELDQFVDPQTGDASYLLASLDGQAMVVDPQSDIILYASRLRERSLRLRYVVDTRGAGSSAVPARRLGVNHGAQVLAGREAERGDHWSPLRNGDDLSLGTLRVRVVTSSDGLVAALIVFDDARPPWPLSVLGGTAFRPGAPPPAVGSAVDDTLAPLLGLPDWVPVYPGSAEALGGAVRSRRPSTTLGFERRFNPFWGTAAPR